MARHGSRFEELSEFGQTLQNLMEEKGIRTQGQLIEALREKAGAQISQQRLSNWIYGKTAVNREFPEQVAVALDLSGKEKMTLAFAFAFGQRQSRTILEEVS